MKDLAVKRIEALARLESSSYDDSKAKRKGVSEEDWRAQKDERVQHLRSLIGGAHANV